MISRTPAAARPPMPRGFGWYLAACLALSALLVIVFWPELYALYREIFPGPYASSTLVDVHVHGVLTHCLLQVDQSGNGWLNDCWR